MSGDLKIPELAISIIYATAISYILINLADNLSNDWLWLSFSSITIFISIILFLFTQV